MAEKTLTKEGENKPVKRKGNRKRSKQAFTLTGKNLGCCFLHRKKKKVAPCLEMGLNFVLD